MCWIPFSSLRGPNGRTEQAQIKSCLMEMGITFDGGGNLLRTQHAVVSCHVQKVIGRTDLAGGAQDSGWTQTRFWT